MHDHAIAAFPIRVAAQCRYLARWITRDLTPAVDSRQYPLLCAGTVVCARAEWRDGQMNRWLSWSKKTDAGLTFAP